MIGSKGDMTMARRIRWIVCLTALYVVAGSSPGVAPAQDARQAEEAGVRAPTVAEVAAEMGANARLRVRWDQGRLTEGELVWGSPRADALGLLSDDGTIEIPYSRIDSLWTRETRSGEGAAIGGLIGAAAGALFLLGVGAATCDAPGGCDFAPSAKGLGLFIGGGAITGAFFGALVGAESVSWEVAFPRE
jgi:hypothetical protein